MANSESDKFYVLCEFVNENKMDESDQQCTTPSQVGFACWIEFGIEEDRKPIKSLIEDKTQVKMKWPQNYDVKCKELMSKLIDIKWDYAIATLLAQSDDWTEIVEAGKSYLKWGVPFPSRSMRKVFVQRSSGDSNELNVPSSSKSELNKEQCASKKPDACRPSKKNGNEKNASKSGAVKKGIKRKCDENFTAIAEKKAKAASLVHMASDSSDEDNEHLRPASTERKVWKQTNTKRVRSIEEDETSESDTGFLDSSKIREDLANKNLVFREDNDRLRRELYALRATKIFLEIDLPAFKSEVKKLWSELKDLKNAVRCLVKVVESARAATTVQECKEKGPQRVEISSQVPIERLANRGCLSRSSFDSDYYDKQTDYDGLVDIEESSFLKKETLSVTASACSDIKPNESHPKLSDSNASEPAAPSGNIIINTPKHNKNKKTTSLRPQPVIDPQATFVFGSKTLTGASVGLCKHSGKVSALVLDLFGLLFTPEEMALCNLTGKTPNGHKSFLVKKKLDESRINGITDYITKFLKGAMTQSEVAGEVKKAVANKLNNFVKTDEAKNIYAAHGLFKTVVETVSA